MSSGLIIGFLLDDVARLMRKRFEQRSRSLGLTRAQWRVLVYIAENEGIHQSALADLLEIEPIVLGRILHKAEERDLIERRLHGSDRRLRLLYLKPAARPLLDIARNTGRLTRNDAFAQMAQDELERFTKTLCRIKSNLLEAREGPLKDHDARHG